MGLDCEYGSNPNPECDDFENCTSTGWSYPPPGPYLPGCGATCPSTYPGGPTGQDEPCPAEGLDCAYPQGQCNCSIPAMSANQSPIWQCTAATPGCPDPRADIGTACTDEGLSCDYGACTGGIAEACQGGIWVEEATACPAMQ